MSSKLNGNGKRARLQDRDPNESMKYRKVLSKDSTQPQERSARKRPTSIEEEAKQRETSLAAEEQPDHDDEETSTVNTAVTSRLGTGHGASPAGSSRKRHVGNDRPIATPRKRLPASPLSQVHNVESDNDAAPVNTAARLATTAAAPKKKPARILLPYEDPKPKKQTQPKKTKVAPKAAPKIAGALKNFNSKAARDKYENERMTHAHDISGNITLPEFKRYGPGSVESTIGPSTLVKPKVPEPIRVPENKDWLQEYLEEQKKRVKENAEQDEFNQPKEVVASKMAALGNLTAMVSSATLPASPKQPSTLKPTVTTELAQTPKKQQVPAHGLAAVPKTANISEKPAEVFVAQQKPTVEADKGKATESPKETLSIDKRKATAEAAKKTTEESPSKSSEEIATNVASSTREFVEKSSLKGFKAKLVKISKKPGETSMTASKASGPTGVSQKDFAEVRGSENTQKYATPENTQLSQEKEEESVKVSKGLTDGNSAAPLSVSSHAQPKENLKESTNTVTKQQKATGNEVDSNASSLRKSAQSLSGIPQKQLKAVGGETTSSTSGAKKLPNGPSATIQEQQHTTSDNSDLKITDNASKLRKSISKPKSSSTNITPAANTPRLKSKRKHNDPEPETDTEEVPPKKRSKTEAADEQEGSDIITVLKTTSAVSRSQMNTPEPESSYIANTATSPEITKPQVPKAKSKDTSKSKENLEGDRELEARNEDTPPEKQCETELVGQNNDSDTINDPKSTDTTETPQEITPEPKSSNTTSASPAKKQGAGPHMPLAKSRRKLNAHEPEEPAIENDRPKKRSKVEEAPQSPYEECSKEDDDDDADLQVANAEALVKLKDARAAKGARLGSTPPVESPLPSVEPALVISKEIESAAPEETQPGSEVDGEHDPEENNDNEVEDEQNDSISSPARSTMSPSTDGSLTPGFPTNDSGDIKPKKGVARKTDPKAREADRKRHERRAAAKKAIGDDEEAKKRAKKFIMD